MVCPLTRAAALSLLLYIFIWPQIVRSLTLPEGSIRDDALEFRLSPGENSRERQHLVPEIVDYNIGANVLRFKLSCNNCPDYETQRFSNEIISVEVVPTAARSCGSTDAIGLRVNGHQLNPIGFSPHMIQGNQGSLASRSVQKSVLDKVHWVNLCSCSGLREDCGDDFESILLVEVKGMRGSKAGFTLTYNQHGSGQLIKISNSADWSLMDTTAAHGSHWNAPLLELQKGAMPTATLLSSFSSVFPSLTASAAPSEYPWISGHVNTVTNPPSSTTASPPSPSSSPSQQSFPPAPSTPPAAVLTVQGQEGWRHHLHTADTVAAFEHSLSAIRSKAQDAAQSLVASLHSMHHCSKDEGPSSISMQGNPPDFLYNAFATPSNTARATIPTPSDESTLSHSGFSEPNTHSHHVTRKQAVLAFQISALATIVLSLSAAMFCLVRRNPRLRAEIAAQHEERRNRRLYRKAACRYRWQQALNRFTQKVTWGRQSRDVPLIDGVIPSDHPADGIDWNEWDEKRISSEDNSVLPSTAGVREGLRELRKAHQLVDGMMSAEEGCYGITNRTNRHQRRWSDSASSEKTAPPPYEEEEVYVADGIRYVRHVTGSTPGSSVIDTSSRSSMADSDSESEKD